MKVTLHLGLTFFCSIWTIGHFLLCYDCPLSKSFEDCQSQQTLVNCSEASGVCFQTSIEYHNESYKREEFDMGCLGKSFCDSYKKGDIGYCNTLRDLGFTVQCISECCYEDECNKENLVESKDSGHFLQCYDCPGSKSFEDCQSQQTLVNCSEASDVCFQTSIEYHNESYKREEFDMGCLGKSFCDSYKKGDIGYCNTLRDLGFTVQCISECCYEDECNKENLVKSKGSALVTSVVILLLGLVLALVNIH